MKFLKVTLLLLIICLNISITNLKYTSTITDQYKLESNRKRIKTKTSNKKSKNAMNLKYKNKTKEPLSFIVISGIVSLISLGVTLGINSKTIDVKKTHNEVLKNGIKNIEDIKAELNNKVIQKCAQSQLNIKKFQNLFTALTFKNVLSDVFEKHLGDSINKSCSDSSAQAQAQAQAQSQSQSQAQAQDINLDQKEKEQICDPETIELTQLNAKLKESHVSFNYFETALNSICSENDHNVENAENYLNELKLNQMNLDAWLEENGPNIFYQILYFIPRNIRKIYRMFKKPPTNLEEQELIKKVNEFRNYVEKVKDMSDLETITKSVDDLIEVTQYKNTILDTDFLEYSPIIPGQSGKHALKSIDDFKEQLKEINDEISKNVGDQVHKYVDKSLHEADKIKDFVIKELEVAGDKLKSTSDEIANEAEKIINSEEIKKLQENVQNVLDEIKNNPNVEQAYQIAEKYIEKVKENKYFQEIEIASLDFLKNAQEKTKEIASEAVQAVGNFEISKYVENAIEKFQSVSQFILPFLGFVLNGVKFLNYKKNKNLGEHQDYKTVGMDFATSTFALISTIAQSAFSIKLAALTTVFNTIKAYMVYKLAKEDLERDIKNIIYIKNLIKNNEMDLIRRAKKIDCEQVSNILKIQDILFKDHFEDIFDKYLKELPKTNETLIVSEIQSNIKSFCEDNINFCARNISKGNLDRMRMSSLIEEFSNLSAEAPIDEIIFTYDDNLTTAELIHLGFSYQPLEDLSTTTFLPGQMKENFRALYCRGCSKSHYIRRMRIFKNTDESKIDSIFKQLNDGFEDFQKTLIKKVRISSDYTLVYELVPKDKTIMKFKALQVFPNNISELNDEENKSITEIDLSKKPSNLGDLVEKTYCYSMKDLNKIEQTLKIKFDLISHKQDLICINPFGITEISQNLRKKQNNEVQQNTCKAIRENCILQDEDINKWYLSNYSTNSPYKFEKLLDEITKIDETILFEDKSIDCNRKKNYLYSFNQDKINEYLEKAKKSNQVAYLKIEQSHEERFFSKVHDFSKISFKLVVENKKTQKVITDKEKFIQYIDLSLVDSKIWINRICKENSSDFFDFFNFCSTREKEDTEVYCKNKLENLSYTMVMLIMLQQ